MKILLVDDEADIVDSLAALLRGLPGNEVKTATTGGQALQAAHAWGGVDLLISDVVMEPMDGFTLRDQITNRYPAARTIFVSGYDLSDYGEQTANYQVLAKPVERAELLGAIAREALAAPVAVAPDPIEPELPAYPSAEETEDETEPEPSAPEPEPEPTPVAPPPPVAPPAPVAAPVAVAAPVVVPRVAAVGVPVARATVAAVPVAVTATAAVAKVATAVPTVAVPRPVAAPAVSSSTAPTVKATATVKAVAAPKVATPKAAVAAPKAVAATPKAATAIPRPSAIAAADRSTRTLPDDEMVGQTIGSYQIQAVLGDGHWGRVYRALQTTINRQVGFNLLSPAHAADEAARARFIGDARAKAHVQHPSILAVYEAGDAGEHFFYAHEYVDGRPLDQLQASGERLDEPTAHRLLKATAEGFDYFHTAQIPHGAVEGSSIYLSVDGNPRLANLATNAATDPVPAPQEIQALGRLVLGVLPPIQSVSPGFRAILSRMVQSGAQSLGSWSELVQALKAIEPKVVPVEAARISAQDRAATAAVEAANKVQKRSVLINVGSMISLALLGVVAVWWWLSGGFSNERNLYEQIQIPAGSFPFGNPPQATEVGEFWIDKYEISIGQYAKFVKHLEDHPTSEFDHPKQPKIKTAEMHKPRDWAIYFGRAAAGKPIHSVPSDLNMPAIMVDWWDAYAYAKWKGRELPTEQEWEKAARGTQGFVYPWGNEFEAKKVNSNADFVLTDPGAPGKVDGFNQWGSVDKQRDKSPFGTLGMAGNVAEWTATWTKNEKFPIIKGGSFMSPDVRLDRRTDSVPPQTAQENLGFRTISRKPPAP